MSEGLAIGLIVVLFIGVLELSRPYWFGDEE